MHRSLTLKLLVLVITAVLPPLAIVAASETWLPSIGAQGQQTVRLSALGLAVLWSAVVAIGGRGWIASETASVVASAERRSPPDQQGSAAAERVARLLEQRDAQLKTLADRVSSAPITEGPAAVLRHMVQTTQLIIADGTWSGVLSRAPGDIGVGVYDTEGTEPRPIQQFHQWAAVTTSPQGVPTVAEGPWGAFLVLRLGEVDGVSAVLLAPWEGRSTPGDADAAVLTLISQLGSGALTNARLFQQVQRQARELDRLATLQSDFLRGVTHDLQSPLASISASASDLREEAAPNVAQGLERIEHQADRMRRMVLQLLTMSKLEAGVLTANTDIFRSEFTVKRVRDALRVPASRLRYVREGPDRLVVGDPDRLEQVLWAVIDNALKYSPPDTPVLIRQSLAEGTASGRTERIEVTDRGIGMSPETVTRAFEQFYRSAEAQTTAPNGSGIGLFTARGLMELMGGSIEISSVHGAGSTVTLELPAEITVDDGSTAAIGTVSTDRQGSL